jgi:hypothetical protein
VCLIAGSQSVRRLAVTRRHRDCSAGRYRAGTGCSIAGSSIVRRLAVTRRLGSACRYQTGTVCSIAGSATTRRAGGAGGRRPGSAGRDQAGTVCLFAGSAATRGPNTVPCIPSSVSAAGAARRPARDWARTTLSWNVVAQGNVMAESVARASRAGGAARASGPVCGPARPGPGGARCRVSSRFRQVRGTDSKGTGEPERPVAGLG